MLKSEQKKNIQMSEAFITSSNCCKIPIVKFCVSEDSVDAASVVVEEVTELSEEAELSLPHAVMETVIAAANMTERILLIFFIIGSPIFFKI